MLTQSFDTRLSLATKEIVSDQSKWISYSYTADKKTFITYCILKQKHLITLMNVLIFVFFIKEIMYILFKYKC